jgi:hypothetical protein
LAKDFMQEQPMRLEPLYRIRFTYPESWAVGLDGGWQQMFFLAEGRCEGWATGRFRGANFLCRIADVAAWHRVRSVLAGLGHGGGAWLSGRRPVAC